MSSQANQRPGNQEIAPVLERNIEALIARRRTDESQKTMQDRVADAITRFTGSMLFVYIHVALFGAWIIINLGWTPLPRFDPSFVVLAMFASVEAIFLSTFVLISQNRMAALNDKRSDLDLQISLLAEHEVTRILQLVVSIAAQLGAQQPEVPELDELVKDVDPEVVLDRLDEQEKRTP
jgi:uncharacterized membrane protein